MRKDQNISSISPSTIYSVALPIGNPQDLSLRALEILKSCDIIAAEDTRQFKLLAKELGLTPKKVYSYHDHSERTSSDELIRLVQSGASLALVSDAGTPLISDPGYHLIKKAHQAQIQVVPIPGPSSLTATLSVCPIGGKTFSFLGFAPPDPDQLLTELKAYALISDRTVCFESPHRIQEHLQATQTLFQDIPIFLAKNISKKYEEYLYLPISELLDRVHTPKGEFVLVYPRLNTPLLSDSELSEHIRACMEQNMSAKDILKKLSSQTSLSRKDLYSLILSLKN